jgi:hypothetical protein
VREVLESPVPLTEDHEPALRLAAKVRDAAGAVQDRRTCCGTMNLAEYYNVEHVLDAETRALARWCAEHGRNAAAGDEAPAAPPASRPGPFEGSGMPAPGSKDPA